jgi:hypothetical protein
VKLSELHRIVNLHQRDELREDPEVVINIKLPYSTVGASPTVKVKSMHLGFDWDSGKFIIHPEEELTPSDRDFAAKMREMQEKWGWAESENRRLKAEIRQLKKKLEGAQ